VSAWRETRRGDTWIDNITQAKARNESFDDGGGI
jgi:hypothetical protein